MTLLRERVANRDRQELLEFIDQLIPAHEIPDEVVMGRSGRSIFHWSEFLHAYDEEFIRNVYLNVFRREPDTSGMKSGLLQLNVEKCSRIELLGRLRYSGEGRRHAVEIEGLWLRYQLARAQRVPVLGAVVGVVANMGDLSRPDVKHQALQTRLDRQAEHITSQERAMAGQFAQVTRQLDDTGIAADSTQAEDAPGNTTADPPTLTQFQRMQGTRFVVTAYRVVLGGRPDDLELDTAMSKLMAGVESKTMLLGKLFDAQGAQLPRKAIQGLPAAYAVERLFALPVIGFFLQLPRAVRFLSHAHTITEFQRRECETQMLHLESRLMQHYNDSVKHLKLKLIELVESDTKS